MFIVGKAIQEFLVQKNKGLYPIALILEQIGNLFSYIHTNKAILSLYTYVSLSIYYRYIYIHIYCIYTSIDIFLVRLKDIYIHIYI